MESHQNAAQSSPGVASHCLPQLPIMGRNARTAQSKSSVKLKSDGNAQCEETILHVDGTSKVIKISSSGVSQLTEIKTRQTEESYAPSEMNINSLDTFDSKVALTPNDSAFLKRKEVNKVNSKTENGPSQQNEITTDYRDDDKVNVTAASNVGTLRERRNSLLSKASYVQGRKQATREKKPLNRKKISKPNVNESIPKAKEENIIDIIAGESEEKKKLPLLSKDASVNMNAKAGDFNASGIHLPRQILILPTEVPHKDQVEKMLGASAETSVLQHPILLEEGEMRWAKVTGHPYWPCMISKCPFSKLLTRMKGETRAVRLYHVQFFGDECERGWIAEPSLMDFKGKLDFLEKAKEAVKKTPKKGQTSYNPFTVKESRQDAWNIAVDEAEHAASLTLEDRKLQYTFQYCFVDKSRKESRLTEKTDIQDISKTSPPRAGRGRKRKHDAIEPNVESPIKITQKRPKLSILSPKTPLRRGLPFQVYFAMHSSSACKDHPDWDKETIRIYLRKQWKLERGLMESKEVGIEVTPEIKDTMQALGTNSPKIPLQRGVPFQVYFATHSSATHQQHPDWDGETLRTFLRKQWKVERMILPSPEKTRTEPWNKSEQGKSTANVETLQPASVTCESRILPKPVLPSADASTSPKPSENLGKRKFRALKKAVIENLISPVQMDTNDESMTESKTLRLSKTASAVNQKQGTFEPSSIIKQEVSDDMLASSEHEMSSLKAKSKAVLARKCSQDSDSSSEGKARKDDEPYELEIFKLISTCKIEKDKLCSICEKTGDLIDCIGSCGQHFHPKCINLENRSDSTYSCAECLSGIHTCFSCKQADKTTIKCSISMCGKYYHETCIKKYRLTRFEAKGFVCPMHICATCAVDNMKNPKAVKGRYYRCIRCPASYHVGDHCIPAGSVVLAGSHIICADHFRPNKALSCHSRLNITWCFTCSKGGTLVCCEACPGAYHAECVKMDKAPDGAWYCEECDAGMRPLYGTIVWIKVGNYRWWPGEICHPRNVPLNIQEKPHQVGEFPVRFFGSHDYYWIHRGRVFLFQEGDKASRDSSAKGLFKTYVKGVQEATEAFKIWTAVKDKKDVQEQERNDKRPAPYKFIKSNVPIGSVQIYKADLSEIPICECKPDQTDACTSDCLNRMMLYECNPATCPAGDKCNNQRFQKRLYVEMEPFKCENRGWGLRCLQDIKKGQFVVEYVGDLIDEEECKKRIEQAHDDNITNFYMLTLDKNRIIDAGPKGNCSRFMNHSCCPNLVTQKWTVNGDIRVGLFALKDIQKGSELTFNYNLECLGNEKKACACGADNCSGFLGVRPKASMAAGAAKDKLAKEQKKKRKKKKLEQRKIYEDECFRCGMGGELVMCDVGNCTKVYHLHCLKLTKPPIGKWRCPWHHCDVCGKHAVSKCVECPDSFCLLHSEGNIFEKNGVQVCEDHVFLLDSVEDQQGKTFTEATPGAAQDQEMQNIAGHHSPALMETSASENVLSPQPVNTKGTSKEINPQQRVKRKYTKRCKSQLVDPGNNKCPIVKITVGADKSESESIHNLKKGSASEPKKSRRERNRYKLDQSKVESKLNNGLSKSFFSSENHLSGQPRSHINRHAKESDDTDSTSSLVIDLPVS